MWKCCLPHWCLGKVAVGFCSRTNFFLRWETDMDAILDFLQNTWTMVGMGVVLVALIGLLFFIRNRRTED